MYISMKAEKTARILLRLEPRQRDLITKAAKLTGHSRSSYIRFVTERDARRILGEDQKVAA